MNEADIQRLVQRRLGSQKGIRLFRNQTGQYKLADGRVIRSGLIKGSADLIGWKEVVITQDMVGKTVAVFTSVEIKTAKGKVSPEQQNWYDKVKQAGGFAHIIRSAEDTQLL
jgi:hypothetical protein